MHLMQQHYNKHLLFLTLSAMEIKSSQVYSLSVYPFQL